MTTTEMAAAAVLIVGAGAVARVTAPTSDKAAPVACAMTSPAPNQSPEVKAYMDARRVRFAACVKCGKDGGGASCEPMCGP